MKAFVFGAVLALVLGVGTALVLDTVSIGSAERFADERIVLPEQDEAALARGGLAHH